MQAIVHEKTRYAAKLTPLFSGELAPDEMLRVWLRVFADNARAIRAYKKAGFVEEGVMREAMHIDGRYVDMAILGIIRPDHDAS